MERLQSTEPSAKISPEGELPCILVYSSETHVDYILLLTEVAKKYLEENRFCVMELKNEVESPGCYLETFLEKAKKCVLGVVILDGFRPNVLFEYGVLTGLGKPIIILKDKNAIINIRTLYEHFESSNCEDVTGLAWLEFKRLQNPRIDSGICNQFSDLSTNITNISEYDHRVSPESGEHITKKLSANIRVIKTKIEKEGEKLMRERAPASMSSTDAERYLEYVARLCSLPLSSNIEEKDIDKIFDDFKNLEKESNIKMPSKIHSLIASLYKSLAERPERNDN